MSGYFYELRIDNSKSPSSNGGVKRHNPEFYDIGIYYYPFSGSNNNNQNNNQNNQNNNQNNRLKFINLDTKKLTNISKKNILFAKKLLCNELSSVLNIRNLEEINLKGANLEGANLEGANLRGANLERANLEEANLRRADLRGANLRRANLRGANLREADLRGAKLEGADIRGALIYRTVCKNMSNGIIPTGLKYSGDVQLQFLAINK
jgi:uncharacterized protein YjbI with pentapeptide repeats